MKAAIRERIERSLIQRGKRMPSAVQALAELRRLAKIEEAARAKRAMDERIARAKRAANYRRAAEEAVAAAESQIANAKEDLSRAEQRLSRATARANAAAKECVDRNEIPDWMCKRCYREHEEGRLLCRECIERSNQKRASALRNRPDDTWKEWDRLKTVHTEMGGPALYGSTLAAAREMLIFDV